MLGAGTVARRPAEDGLTLIEMLVVLAIIGVAAGATALGIGAVTRAPSVETEARRLATQLQAAADDAMLGDRMVAFTVEKHGYGFATIGADGRPVARTGDAFGFHRLPAGMTMTLKLDGPPPILLGVDGSGKPMSATIESGSQRWLVAYDGMTASAAKVPAGQ